MTSLQEWRRAANDSLQRSRARRQHSSERSKRNRSFWLFCAILSALVIADGLLNIAQHIR